MVWLVDDWTMAGVCFVAVPAKRYDVTRNGLELALKVPYFSTGFPAPGGVDPRFSEFKPKATHGLHVHHRILTPISSLTTQPCFCHSRKSVVSIL